MSYPTKAILYSGMIYQSGSSGQMTQITASESGRYIGTVTASFSSQGTGSYRMGANLPYAFSGKSGSLTGSLYINASINYSYLTGSISSGSVGFEIYPTGSTFDSLWIKIYSNTLDKTLSNNVFPSGALNLEIGIVPQI